MATKTKAVIAGVEWELMFKPADMKWMRDSYGLDFRELLQRINVVRQELSGGVNEGKATVEVISVCDAIAPLLATISRRDPKHGKKTPAQILAFFEDLIEFDNLIECTLPVFECVGAAMARVKDPSEEKKELTAPVPES